MISFLFVTREAEADASTPELIKRVAACPAFVTCLAFTNCFSRIQCRGSIYNGTVDYGGKRIRISFGDYLTTKY